MKDYALVVMCSPSKSNPGTHVLSVSVQEWEDDHHLDTVEHASIERLTTAALGADPRSLAWAADMVDLVWQRLCEKMELAAPAGLRLVDHDPKPGEPLP